jgi:hypothetical protein
MSNPFVEPGFAPNDLSDGRKPCEWKTRYPDKEARHAIVFEAIYGFFLLILSPVVFLIIWLKLYNVDGLFSDSQCEAICRYAFAWFGGLFGGNIFALKWLYHSVAHATWNKDRLLWRLLTPHLSGAISFAFICMIDSQILLIFDANSTKNPPVVVSVAFLVGYFSDSALAKMSEIAMSLFGTKGKSM